MTPEQAKFLLDSVYLPQINMERGATRRVIEAIPADKSGYKPDPSAKSALDLAWHLATAECFFLNSVASGEFVFNPPPPAPATPREILAWYDENAPKATAAAAAASPENLAKVMDFRGLFKVPSVMFLGFMVNHGVHHRGQLSTYLRPMGAKCPSIYGPSADTPVQQASA